MPEISGWWIMLWWVFSAAAQALPDPVEGERWYGFAYRFIQLLGANLKQMMPKGVK